MSNIATITNNIISALSGTSSQVLLGNATLTDFKLDSLTDVSVPTPGDGDVLRWNATTSLWEASDSAGITGSGAAGQVAYFTGATTQAGSNNLFWNSANNRLGIGTNTPTSELDIFGRVLIRGIETSTTGDINVFSIQREFAPTSGNATYTALLITPTINQTGGANGITAGLYIAPILTSAPRWRTIEWFTNSGYGLYGLGTAPNFLQANLLLGDGTNSGERLQVNGTAKVTGNVTLVSLAGTGNRMVIADSSGVLSTQAIPTGNVGTVTSIATTGPITGGTITSSGTIGITQATTSTDGFLSSTDFNTFNNKQNALTNPITGTGAAGQVAYFTGATTQAGSNNLFWDNTNGRLGIGTNTPEEIFTIQATSPVLRIRENNSTSTNTPTIRILNSANNQSNIYLHQSNYTSVNRAKAGQLNISNNGAGGIVLAATSTDTNATIDFVTQSFPSAFASILCARITNGGNFLLGSASDSGQRLQVTGDTLLRGSGNTSATIALSVTNSDGSSLLRTYNDGQIGFGTIGTTIIAPADIGTGAVLLGANARALLFRSEVGTGNGYQFFFSNSNFAGGAGQVGGTNGVINITSGFRPASGGGVFNTLLIGNTINQTGGANGITRGLYVNPTLTAAADWRSIEWSNNSGWGLYGAGTARNFLNGNTVIGDTNELNAAYKLTAITSGGPNFIASAGYGDVSTQSGYFYMLKGRGTRTSPTALLSGDVLGSLNFAGYFTTSTFSTTFSIFTQAASNFTSLLNPVNLIFRKFDTGGNTTDVMRLTSTDNLIIQSGGTFTDSGQRLQVTGDTLLRGSGNTSATTALTVQNSDATNMWRFRNDGSVRLGELSTAALIFPFATTYNTPDPINGRNIQFFSAITSQSAFLGAFYFAGSNYAQASGAQIFTNITNGFAPTSGTATFALLNVGGTINQTGGANGITRGLFVNPTLTAAADWRSIEWSNNTGWGLYGAGTANNYLNGDTYIGTTTTSATKLTISGSETAASGIARGELNNTTLVASANNDVLVGLDINPTFTNGSFTGVNNIPLRVGGTTVISGGFGDAAARIRTLISNLASGTYTQLAIQGPTNGGAAVEMYDGSGNAVADFGMNTLAKEFGFVNRMTSGFINFYTHNGSSLGSRLHISTVGNVLINSTTDSGERLQVTGTAKITGASSFGGNMTLSLNQNAETSISISNTTAGTTAITRINLTSDSTAGSARLFKYSSLNTGYKTIAASDFGIFNITAGDISLLNDFATGNIKFAAGGSSTAHMTIKSNGRINMSSLPTSATGLSAGDLWNDGGTLKIA
jgi:hypothetical protein